MTVEFTDDITVPNKEVKLVRLKLNKIVDVKARSILKQAYDEYDPNEDAADSDWTRTVAISTSMFLY